MLDFSIIQVYTCIRNKESATKKENKICITWYMNTRMKSRQESDS